jgi:RNA polymerase sigma-70 factor (ECF subfamily)
MINDKSLDEEIIKSILAGKSEDFIYIVKRYQQRVYSIGYRFFKNEDDARDFTQELFIKILEKLNTLKNPEQFKAWLTRIAYNMGINKTRKEGDSSEVEYVEIYSAENTLDKQHLKKEVNASLHKAILALPEKYRICIDLYFFWGMKHKEISEATSISINTIKSNVLRAKQLLRDNLKGTIAEEYHEV